MLAGKTITNNKNISWYVPNFRAVKTDYYNAEEVTNTLELTRIVSAPVD
jgi:hypothetical protein